ncbi:MAG TPA: biotin/lipoyl-binding protein, partial [Vicinamibacterales bacterium]|nr:biotin/lipoyl-binding protein [Vicinamibacterales bacterium]
MLRLLALLAGFSLVTTACSSPPEATPAETATVPVSVGVVDSRDWPSFTEAGGTLEARLTAVVSSRILAPIVAVHVRAGDTVRRGQVVVEMDAAEYRAQAARSTSSLEAARLAADAAAADATGAEAALELARLTHDRIRKLHEQKSATTQELDQAVAGLTGAQSRLTAARAAAESASAAFAAARSAAEAGDIVATYAALTAPFDGTVV